MGDLAGAAEAARRAYAAARAQRSNQLVSEAWIGLIETLAANPDNDLTLEFREAVEGAFYWAETMPEEIQVWMFVALVPHLQALGFRRLVDRAEQRRERASAWLAQGNVNVMTRCQEFHLTDLAGERPLDRPALALERQAAFLADELFDPEGRQLDVAADRWRQVGRDDRADFLASLAAELRARGVHAP
jgi:hypothetical protein